MDLKRLEYFCTIVEQGQISKAARALHISQPPLSLRLKELEEELDVQLIYREGKAWQVTPEGEQLYQKAQYILSYINGIQEDLRKKHQSISGLVRIGVCPACLTMISILIPSLAHEFPKLRFRIWVMDTQSLERHLQERNLDFALVQLPLYNDNYFITSLETQSFLAVYGQGLFPPEWDSIAVQDLVNIPIMLGRRRDRGDCYDFLIRAFQEQGKHAQIVLDSQDTRFLHMLLKQGMPAVALLPENEVRADILDEFPIRRLSIPGLELTPVVIALERTYLSPSAKEVINRLVNAYGGLEEDVFTPA